MFFRFPCDEEVPMQDHPVRRALDEVDHILADVTDVPVDFRQAVSAEYN